MLLRSMLFYRLWLPNGAAEIFGGFYSQTPPLSLTQTVTVFKVFARIVCYEVSFEMLRKMSDMSPLCYCTRSLFDTGYPI